MSVVHESPEIYGSRFTRLDIFVIPFILCLVVVANFWPFISRLGTVGFMGLSDAIRYSGPMLCYGDYWIHRGELPLWNPLINCGQPFSANPQSFFFYPPNLLRNILTVDPTPFRTHLGRLFYVIAHISIGSSGAYVFARSHRFTIGASLASGIVFGLSAGMVNRAIPYEFHYALVWLPFIFWAMYASMQAQRLSTQFSYASIAGVAYGMAILAGTPIFMVLFGFLLGFYCLLYRCAYHDWKSAQQFRTLLAGMISDGVKLGIVLSVGVLVASPMLLPSLELASYSNRFGFDSSLIDEMTKTEVDWNVWQLLCLYPGDDVFESIRGAGAVAMMIAFAGIVTHRRKELLIYGSLLLIALDCSLTEPLFSVACSAS